MRQTCSNGEEWLKAVNLKGGGRRRFKVKAIRNVVRRKVEGGAREAKHGSKSPLIYLRPFVVATTVSTS